MIVIIDGEEVEVPDPVSPEPISTAQAKAYLRIIDLPDDAETIFPGFIQSAREWVENYTGHILKKRQITKTLNGFGSFIELDQRPIVSVDEVSYLGDGVGAQSFPDFSAIPNLYPLRIYPLTQWPRIRDDGYVTVTYTAGYESGEVPQQLVSAIFIRLMIDYERRSATRDEERALEALCSPFRMVRL